MGNREGGGCCGGVDTAAPFGDRLEVGRRRRVQVRRVLLACSAVLGVAALMLTLIDPPGAAGLAPRVAWAASVWAAGLVFGWLRQAITGRRLGWRLVASLAALVVGIAWQPLVPALVAVALLTEHVLRSPPAETSVVDGRGVHSASQLG